MVEMPAALTFVAATAEEAAAWVVALAVVETLATVVVALVVVVFAAAADDAGTNESDTGRIGTGSYELTSAWNTLRVVCARRGAGVSRNAGSRTSPARTTTLSIGRCSSGSWDWSRGCNGSRGEHGREGSGGVLHLDGVRKTDVS